MVEEEKKKRNMYKLQKEWLRIKDKTTNAKHKKACRFAGGKNSCKNGEKTKLQSRL